MNMRLVYPAIFYEDTETGAYAVEVPDLPGCVSGGDTLADAVLMAEDAAAGWVLSELEDGVKVPVSSPINAVKPDRGGFVSMIVLDMDTYAQKYGDKAVRKNLTIPAWLNTFAEANNVNFSQVLQDSLTKMYMSA
jgi:predicted RNase H-like HicB family nuclease